MGAVPAEASEAATALDVNTMQQLMTAAGAAETALAAHELAHGYRPKPGPVMDEHNRLLWANADAKAALRCRVSGVYRHELFARPSKEPISPERTNTTKNTQSNHMKIGDAFPSKYMKAEDLDEDLTLTIKSVEMEEIGQGADKSTKPVIYFKGLEKGFVANKTNCTTISNILGTDDTDEWEGQRITLRAAEVEFQGKMVMSIRVSLKKPVSASLRPAQPADQDGN